MLPEPQRTLAALRYTQSEEARRIVPFEATLGEVEVCNDHRFVLDMV